MQSSVFGDGGGAEVPATRHAATKTIFRVAVDGLPPHATPEQIKRALGAVGVEAPHVKVELNPLSGDASGRGEVTFRNVTDKQKLLDLLHARPAALMHGRAVQVTYDDTEPKSARSGA